MNRGQQQAVQELLDDTENVEAVGSSSVAFVVDPRSRLGRLLSDSARRAGAARSVRRGPRSVVVFWGARDLAEECFREAERARVGASIDAARDEHRVPAVVVSGRHVTLEAVDLPKHGVAA